MLIFSCRCCGNQYASTDGVRKHARKAHAKWLKAKDQDTTDRIASGERLCRSDAYCEQRRVPRSEAEALMAERERPVGRPAKAARRASREAAAHGPRARPRRRRRGLRVPAGARRAEPAADRRPRARRRRRQRGGRRRRRRAGAAGGGGEAFGGGGGGFGPFTDRVVFGGQPPLKRGASLMSVFGDTAQFDAEDYALDRAASSVARPRLRGRIAGGGGRGGGGGGGRRRRGPGWGAHTVERVVRRRDGVAGRLPRRPFA